jgi:hypothetical protein
VQVLKKIPEDLDAFEGELVVAVVGKDERPLRSTNAWIDWRLYGSLTNLLAKGLFQGELGEKCLLPTYGKFSFDRILLIGGGDLFEADVYPTSDRGRERWMSIGAQIDETLQSLRVEKVGLSLPRFDMADHERALLQSLQASPLRADIRLFVARATQTYGAAGLSMSA